MPKHRSDAGSALVMSVLIAWMIMAFAMIVVTLALRETVPTVVRINETSNIATAQAGAEATLARIKGASTVVTTSTGQTVVGSPGDLPCGAIEDSSAGVPEKHRYSGVVRYYTKDPAGRIESWRREYALDCAAVSKGAAKYALIEVVGDDGSRTGFTDPQRRIEVVYELAKYRSLPGGKIRFRKVPEHTGNIPNDGCLTADKSVSGAWKTDPLDSLYFRPCKEEWKDRQTWIHYPNMTLVLAASLHDSAVDSAYCVRRTEIDSQVSINRQLWLDECSPNPISHTTAFYKFFVGRDRQLIAARGSFTKGGAYSSLHFCIKPEGAGENKFSKIPYGRRIELDVNCGQRPLYNTNYWRQRQNTYLEIDPNVGDPSISYPKVISSYRFPGMCANIEDALMNNDLILSYCELDRSQDDRGNSRFEYIPYDGGRGLLLVEELQGRVLGHCLQPKVTDPTELRDAVDADPSKLGVRVRACPSSYYDTTMYHWKVEGATGNALSSNTIRHADSGLCLAAVDESIRAGSGAIRLEECNGSDRQKWNVRYLLTEGGGEVRIRER